MYKRQNNILPLGSVVYVMFCVSKYGWGWDGFIKEVNTGKGIKFPKGIRFYMMVVIPVIIVVIYLKGYFDKFAGQVLLLRRKLDLLLRTGKLLMESAADTNRIERNMKRVAAYLGIPHINWNLNFTF